MFHICSTFSRHPCMASALPLQADHLPNPNRSKNGLKSVSSPHFLSVSTNHSNFRRKLNARNMFDKMPPREQTYVRRTRDQKAHKALTLLISSRRSVDEGNDSVSDVGFDGGKWRDESRISSNEFLGVDNRQDDPIGLKNEKEGTKGRKVKADSCFMVEKRVEEKLAKIKKAKGHSAEFEFRVRLDMCSKMGDVIGAISLYESAVRDGVKLNQYHYNVLLYLCSSAAIGVVHPAKSGTGFGSRSNSVAGEDESEDFSENSEDDVLDNEEDIQGNEENYGMAIQVSEDVRNYARIRGFEIYEKMCLDGIPMSEAALTSVARMAMSVGNGDLAFEIVKYIKSLGISPKLRSYGPALFSYCNNGDIEKAFEVEEHMLRSGVCPEEPELEALLRASVVAGRGDKVYHVLHQLRTNVRQVSPSTANVIEQWFCSTTAARLGKRKWSRRMVAQTAENGGGGWHGLGWLGMGRWILKRTHVDCNGVCLGCGGKLVTIDLDPVETENFARSVASMACKRERNSNFLKFQKWLDYYGPFEAVVDAANVGLSNQKQFSVNKVNALVNSIRQRLPSKKWPLIIVHNKRVTGGRIDEPTREKIIEKWKNADCIYATPTGSNDDWYWLYAAIKCKSLIITNDEMRDHIFQILGNDFFPKWKERHQVHFSYRNGSFEFHLPPPCSVVIQESERGHWHVPVRSENGLSVDITWLCVTRLDARAPKSPILHKGHTSAITNNTNSSSSHAADIAAHNLHFGESWICRSEGHRRQERAQASTETSLLPDDESHEHSTPISGHQNQKVVRDCQEMPVKFQTPHSIISKLEAAEKLCTGAIDFQI